MRREGEQSRQGSNANKRQDPLEPLLVGLNGRSGGGGHLLPPDPCALGCVPGPEPFRHGNGSLPPGYQCRNSSGPPVSSRTPRFCWWACGCRKSAGRGFLLAPGAYARYNDRCSCVTRVCCDAGFVVVGPSWGRRMSEWIWFVVGLSVIGCVFGLLAFL